MHVGEFALEADNVDLSMDRVIARDPVDIFSIGVRRHLNSGCIRLLSESQMMAVWLARYCWIGRLGLLSRHWERLTC